MKTTTVVKYYWSIPINLEEMAKFFKKAKNKRDLKFIIHVLRDTANHIESAMNLKGV